ncbi:MAG: hypothetical protein AAF432_07575 [Planctomycetota bacterium]
MVASETPMLFCNVFVQIALIVFVIVFIGIVLYAVFARQDTMDSKAQIPLEEQLVEPRAGSSTPASESTS